MCLTKMNCEFVAVRKANKLERFTHELRNVAGEPSERFRRHSVFLKISK